MQTNGGLYSDLVIAVAIGTGKKVIPHLKNGFLLTAERRRPKRYDKFDVWFLFNFLITKPGPLTKRINIQT